MIRLKTTTLTTLMHKSQTSEDSFHCILYMDFNNVAQNFLTVSI